MQPLVLILSILGALSGGILVISGAGKIARRSSRWWQNRGTVRDYYIERLDHACRIIEPERKVQFVRQVTLVSQTDGLSTFRVGHNSTVKTNRIASVTPEKYTLRAAAATLPYGEWWERDVCFDRPLRKGERATFTLTVTSEYPEAKPERSFHWMSEHRVDELILRVVFTWPLPQNAEGREVGVDGSVLRSTSLPIDAASGECRFLVKRPRPGRLYTIVW